MNRDLSQLAAFPDRGKSLQRHGWLERATEPSEKGQWIPLLRLNESLTWHVGTQLSASGTWVATRIHTVYLHFTSAVTQDE